MVISPVREVTADGGYAMTVDVPTVAHSYLMEFTPPCLGRWVEGRAGRGAGGGQRMAWHGMAAQGRAGQGREGCTGRAWRGWVRGKGTLNDSTCLFAHLLLCTSAMTVLCGMIAPAALMQRLDVAGC
jgi:hypothetical protein